MIVQSYVIPFDEELLPTRTLTFGDLSCIYEHGRIRYVKHGDTEVIRMIYFAVRDQNWKTPEYIIKNESIEQHSTGFSISYTALHQAHDISYRVDVRIEALNHNIVFQVSGEAESSFKRNRIGICVLHPVEEYRGREVHVTRPDGSGYDSRFPDLISPHQPFRDIRNLHCKVGDEISVEFNFEGDTFETEDQRNWADSSFKTYSTPLNLPMPVAVNKGDQLHQKLSIQIERTGTLKRDTTVDERKIAFPKIGYGAVAPGLHPNEIALLRQLPFDHYRVEVSLFTTGWEPVLTQKLQEARELNTVVEFIVVFSENVTSDLEKFLANIEGSLAIVSSILLLQKGKAVMPEEHFRWLYREIKKRNQAINVGYGTDGFFADINRNRPSFQELDFICFSLNPQVHSSDARSVLENLQQLGDIIQTARSFAPDKHVHISPITFKIREDGSQDGDPRQHRNFGAMWTLVAMKNLASADRLTFYQATGYRGVLHETESPLFNLLKVIKAFDPKWFIDIDNRDEILPDKVVLENERGERLLLDLKKI